MDIIPFCCILVMLGVFLFALEYWTMFVIKTDHDWGYIGLALFFVGFGYYGLFKERSLRRQGRGYKQMPWENKK